MLMSRKLASHPSRVTSAHECLDDPKWRTTPIAVRCARRDDGRTVDSTLRKEQAMRLRIPMLIAAAVAVAAALVAAGCGRRRRERRRRWRRGHETAKC